jgi:hypothetical protein
MTLARTFTPNIARGYRYSSAAEVEAAESCMRDAMKHARTVWLVLSRTTVDPVGAATLIDADAEYEASADQKHDRSTWCRTFRVQLNLRASLHVQAKAKSATSLSTEVRQ